MIKWWTFSCCLQNIFVFDEDWRIVKRKCILYFSCIASEYTGANKDIFIDFDHSFPNKYTDKLTLFKLIEYCCRRWCSVAILKFFPVLRSKYIYHYVWRWSSFSVYLRNIKSISIIQQFLFFFWIAQSVTLRSNKLGTVATGVVSAIPNEKKMIIWFFLCWFSVTIFVRSVLDLHRAVYILV